MNLHPLPPPPPLPLLPRAAGRRGAALLAVLWVLSLLGTVAALGLSQVRDGVAAATNRAEAVRGRWRAEGCLAVARATLDRALRRGLEERWYEPVSGDIAGCVALDAAAPPEGPVDVNIASFERLRTLPGFDSRLAWSVVELRKWDERLADFADLVRLAPPDQEARLLAAYADLRAAIAYEPQAWLVTADGRVTERWVRAQQRVAVVGRLIR